MKSENYSVISTGNMHRMAAIGARWWNDSCDLRELADAVEHGAVGATSNPVIVASVVEGDKPRWIPVIRSLIQEDASLTEDEITWKLIAEIGRQAAAILYPTFVSSGGGDGYLSMQVNPKFYPSSELMTKHGLELAALAPNIAIKVPATAAGLQSVYELTARGIRVNVTISFTVAQAVAAAEAIERGLLKATQSGLDVRNQRPYVTLMEGRLDDQLKRARDRGQLTVQHDALEWAGVAVFKKTAGIFKARRFRSTLLAAAYRNVYQWSEIIGPSVLQSIPYAKWKEYHDGEVIPKRTLETPVAEEILHELSSKFVDFNCAYEEKGMSIDEFVSFEATRHTLMQFNNGYAQLVALIRAEMLR